VCVTNILTPINDPCELLNTRGNRLVNVVTVFQTLAFRELGSSVVASQTLSDCSCGVGIAKR
jgi:hypothetical protein